MQINFLMLQYIVPVCVAIILIAILIDFLEYHSRRKARVEKKSVVETGTMFLFFFGYYALLCFRIGVFLIESELVKNSLFFLGIILLIIGTLVNVLGRFSLGKNWSNQIKIYENHSFVSSGVYSFVRHPLYASLIWMFLAGALIYSNFAVLLATLLIFIPFMYYRAKQEELLLAKEFKEYGAYQKKVGMFFSKINL